MAGHFDGVVAVVAGLHLVALPTQEEHVGLEQFDLVVDPEDFDHDLSFTDCKFTLFTSKRKNREIIGD